MMIKTKFLTEDSTNVSYHRKELSRHGDQAPVICAHLIALFSWRNCSLQSGRHRCSIAAYDADLCAVLTGGDLSGAKMIDGGIGVETKDIIIIIIIIIIISFMLIFLRQTMSLDTTVLQLFCCCCLWCI